MISVIIPLFNKELYIKSTIENVLNQTFQSFEIIVVNDGSIDNGPKIVESFSDQRIRLINKENGGVSSARNVGIQNAKFDYIAFLDADDVWLPNHLKEVYTLILNYSNKAEVFVTNFARKYPDGRVVQNRRDKELKGGIIENYFKLVLKKAIIHTSCVCVTKKILIEVGMFDERMSRGEDIDLWTRLARESMVAYNSYLTTYYLQEAVNNSNKKFNITKSYSYYIDKKKFISKEDRLYNNKIIFKKYLSLLKDLDISNFIKLIKKQGVKL